MKKSLTYFALAVGMLIPVQVFAIGLSASPSELDVRILERSEEQVSIKVTNTSRDVALFDVYPDEMRRLVTVSPSSFTLEAGESKKVLIDIVSEQTGVYSTHISVVARALSDNVVTASGGVKIPLEVTVTKENVYQMAGALTGAGRLVDSAVVAITAFLIILNLAMLLYLQSRKVFQKRS